MFTWVCPKCGREVPPAYDECPDCAGKTGTQPVPGVATPTGAAAPPQQSQPMAPPSGTRGARRPLWATGPQEPLPPTPPPSFAPPAPASVAEAPAAPPEEPAAFRPPKPVTSPLFAEPQSEAPRYAVAQPAGPPKWLLGVAIAVIVVIVGGGLYWFFGRPQTTSAVIVNQAPKTPAGENPLQKYIEVTGIRFGPQAKGVSVRFIVINHSDSDLALLAGTVTIFAKTEQGQEIQVGTVKFQTGMAAQASQELTLPLDTKMKLVEMPDWQNASAKVEITSPSGA